VKDRNKQRNHRKWEKERGVSNMV